MERNSYIAIDLKSFYASVECVYRGLDPLNTNLVVADTSRTEKTICLAVSPALKTYGVSGRPRLFEVIQKVREVNIERKAKASAHRFRGKSVYKDKLDSDSSLMLDYIAAKPRMAEYVRISSDIYGIYLRHISPEDIHVYSIDEVFIDAAPYLKSSGMDARQFAGMLIREVLKETGVTATAGIGTNMYLAKIAMDIVAKHIPADKGGVRIAQLDETSYRKELWSHRPVSDFWRIGKGYERRLAQNGMFTMGDVARCSEKNEELLYRLFGVNAELLIDHAWGWEPCTMKAVKDYVPESGSVSISQVLAEPYPFAKALIVAKEMATSLAFELTSRGLMTKCVGLNVNYDVSNVSDYSGSICSDWYGRTVPVPVHASVSLKNGTCSVKNITAAIGRLFESIVNKNLYVRRITLAAADEKNGAVSAKEVQLDLFADDEVAGRERRTEEIEERQANSRQKAILEIRDKYGKNAILAAMDLQDGATAVIRNQQIGGHNA